MLRGLRYQGLAIGWALFILIICNMRMGDITGDPKMFFPGFDKLTHTGLFFVQTVLVLFALLKQNQKLSIGALAMVILLMTFFGGLIEVLQWKVFTYRGGEWADLFADVVGIGMGAFSVYLTKYALTHEK
jgi:VanZ family protein